jgi:phage terminase large subunit
MVDLDQTSLNTNFVTERAEPKQTILRIEDMVNPSYLKDLFQNRDRLLAVRGGAAAGKSWAVAQKLVLRCLLYKRERILVVRKTLPALKLTCLKMLKDTCEAWHIPYSFNREDMVMKVRDSEFIFLSVVNTSGGAAAERLKSLTDITAVWVEEATELSENEMTQIILRMRGRALTGGSYYQLIVTFNPIDAGHWLHKWIEVTHRMTDVKKTYHDNKFLDPDYVKTLEDLKDQDMNTYRVYCLGDWGSLENVIYTRYVQEDFYHAQSEYEFTCAGLDWGFEHPAAWVPLGIIGNDVYVVDEICQSHLTNTELIQLVQEHQRGIGWNDIPTVGDSAEPARIEEFEQSGFAMYPAEKDVVDGINYVKGFTIHISPRCVNFLKQIQAYKRRVDRNGVVLEDPVKWLDDLMDAMRYALYTYLRQGGMGGWNV